MTLDELKLARTALMQARFKGLRSATYDGRSVTYGSDTEMATALAELDRLIGLEEVGAPAAPRRFIYTTTSKGL